MDSRLSVLLLPSGCPTDHGRTRTNNCAGWEESLKEEGGMEDGIIILKAMDAFTDSAWPEQSPLSFPIPGADAFGTQQRTGHSLFEKQQGFRVSPIPFSFYLLFPALLF